MNYYQRTTRGQTMGVRPAAARSVAQSGHRAAAQSGESRASFGVPNGVRLLLRRLRDLFQRSPLRSSASPQESLNGGGTDAALSLVKVTECGDELDAHRRGSATR